jgi:hypothetical protein
LRSPGGLALLSVRVRNRFCIGVRGRLAGFYRDSRSSVGLGARGRGERSRRSVTLVIVGFRLRRRWAQACTNTAPLNLFSQCSPIPYLDIADTPARRGWRAKRSSPIRPIPPPSSLRRSCSLHTQPNQRRIPQSQPTVPRQDGTPFPFRPSTRTASAAANSTRSVIRLIALRVPLTRACRWICPYRESAHYHPY